MDFSTWRDGNPFPGLIFTFFLLMSITIAGCSNENPLALSQSGLATSATSYNIIDTSETPTILSNPGVKKSLVKEVTPAAFSTPGASASILDTLASPTQKPDQALFLAATPTYHLTQIPTIQSKSNAPGSKVSAPKMIYIPALEIDTNIESVGLTEDRAMDVPKNWRNVGWYELGFGPGQFGNMVMTGHVDSPLSDDGIFNNLHQLEIGDRIYLQTEDGTRYGYIVENYHYFPYDGAPMEEIFGFSSEPRLNLITCRGNWNESADTYDQRLVIYTRQTHSVEADTDSIDSKSQ